MQEELFQIRAMTTCPRCAFVLTHDQLTDKYHFEVVGREDFFVHSENRALVHFALLSDFAPYFIFMDEDSMNNASDAVTQLLVATTDFALMNESKNDKFVPNKLRKFYNKTVTYLRRIYDGCFITNLFQHKLWDLVYRTWKHVVVYKTWCANQSFRCLQNSLATELFS